MSARESIVCKDVRRWLAANLGRQALAALTGTDSRALSAAVHILSLYTSSGDKRVLNAFGYVVTAMQPSTRYLAYHAIAHVMDWDDRARVWEFAGLTAPDRIPRCECEP